jgi:hypothetical protein
VRIGSWRWWFENRETGDLAIVQFPNRTLWAAGSSEVLGRLVEKDSLLHDMVGWASVGLWVYWGLLELFRGVNPWRRLLGLGVILWELRSLVV